PRGVWVQATCLARRRGAFPLAEDRGPQPGAPGARYEEGLPPAPTQSRQRDRRYPRVTLEEMATLAPEVILLPDEPYVFNAADITDFAPFPDVPAVRDGRIYLIDGKMVSWYGPRIGHSLRTLRDLLTHSPSGRGQG